MKNMTKKTKIILGALSAALLTVVCGMILFFVFFRKTTDPALLEEQKKQEWFDVAYATRDIEEKYHFLGSDEEKLAEYDAMTKELETLFKKMKKEGVLESYEKGILSYYLYFEDGLSYVYSIPFPTGDVLAGGGSETESEEDSDAVTEDGQATNDSDTGSVLLVENCSNQKNLSPDIIRKCGGYLTGSDLNYTADYYDEDDCNTMTKAYELLTSLDRYDVIIWEGHGEAAGKEGDSTKICLANNVPFAEYEKFIKKHPEFDFTKEDQLLPGLLIGAGSYSFANGDESKEQLQYKNKFGQVVDTVKIVIDASTIEALYEDGSFKDTILYLGCCLGAQNDILPNTFLKKGARSVMVYKNLLTASYHAKMADYIFSRLPVIEYDSGELWTVDAVVEAAKGIYGELDPTYAEDSFWNRITNQYEEESERSYLVVYSKEEQAVRMKDYTQIANDNADTSEEGNTDGMGGDAGGNTGNTGDTSGTGSTGSTDTGNSGDTGTGTETGTPDGGSTSSGADTGERQIVDIDITMYDSYFDSLKDGNTYLSMQDLISVDDTYKSVRERLLAEGSEDMASVLENAMNLFCIVSYNNANYVSYDAYTNYSHLEDVGYTNMSDVIKGYENKKRIGYYTLLYIGSNYVAPARRMEGFMNSMDARNTSAEPYTAAEQDALELCKLYLYTFYNHNQNTLKICEYIIEFAENPKRGDYVSAIASSRLETYQKEVQHYYDMLAELENYFK